MVKEFVRKSNRNRYKNEYDGLVKANEPVPETYAAFNRKMLLNEWIGHVSYGRTNNTPKAYISAVESTDPKNKEKEYFFNTENLSSEFTLTLQEYLNVTLKMPLDYSDQEKNEIKEKLNKLKDFGPLCFMSLLLGDRDVFGRGLSNVLVKDQDIYKIDTADIQLPLGVYGITEDANAVKKYNYVLEKYLPLFLNSKEEILVSHDTSPYVSLFLSLLNDEQKKSGLAAIKAFIQEPGFTETLNEIAKSMDHPEVLEQVKETIKKRAEIIINNYAPYVDPENKIQPSKVKDIRQNQVIRSDSDFVATGKIIPAGNSQPQVTQKVSETAADKIKLELLVALKEDIKKNVIEYLKSKIELLDHKIESNNNKGRKLKFYLGVQEDYLTLYEQLKIILGNKHIKDKDIVKIYQSFVDITNNFTNHINEYPKDSPRSISFSEKIMQGVYELTKNSTKQIFKSVPPIDTSDTNIIRNLDQLVSTHKSKFENYFHRKKIKFETLQQKQPEAPKENKSENINEKKEIKDSKQETDASKEDLKYLNPR